jgi:hypothetical protein
VRVPTLMESRAGKGYLCEENLNNNFQSTCTILTNLSMRTPSDSFVLETKFVKSGGSCTLKIAVHQVT